MDLNIHSLTTIRDRKADPLDAADLVLIESIQAGLPLVSRPYAEIGARIGMAEGEVIDRLARLLRSGAIKRIGVVVRHHELGYRANAMVVWDVPDDEVSALGRCMGSFEFVTLCYRRARDLPSWPYNLFCMIHGRDRAAVQRNIEVLVEQCGLRDMPHETLFSQRRFKQRGAVYTSPKRSTEATFKLRGAAIDALHESLGIS
jgi:DNA-binding Lrp family transcriptional regulator